jgi:hypothetical protein
MVFNKYDENTLKQPLIALNAQYKIIKPEIDEAIQRVLNHTEFILGPEVEMFEKEFSEYIGTKYAVGVASGTDALIIALESAGIGSGDEVITTPTTFFATTEAILSVGATPVFVDIDETGNINSNLIVDKISKKTKAILPVHLFGNPCNLSSILQYGVPVIEDSAQACGAMINNQKVGSIGLVGCFSFFPGKNLGCYGDGGMIATNDRDIYEKARSLRKHGAKERYTHYYIGHNSRLDTIQAAVLRVKLKYLDEWNKKRREIALKYLANLKKYEHIKLNNDCCTVYNYFCFYAKNRDELIKKLESKGIATGIYFPIAIPHLPVFKSQYKMGDFPMAERHAKEVIALPMYPELTDNQIDNIVEILR